jgi:hypothetical protein
MLNGSTYGAIYGSSRERTGARDGSLSHDDHRRILSLGHQTPTRGTNLLECLQLAVDAGAAHATRARGAQNATQQVRASTSGQPDDCRASASRILAEPLAKDLQHILRAENRVAARTNRNRALVGLSIREDRRAPQLS